MCVILRKNSFNVEGKELKFAVEGVVSVMLFVYQLIMFVTSATTGVTNMISRNS